MGLPMQPRAGKFFALFTKASPDVVQSAAIVMESVAAPYGHWAEIANRMHDAEHAGDDTTKPDGRRPTPGPASLAGPAFILCSRVCLADAVSSELSHDDRMHDLLVFLARAAGRRAVVNLGRGGVPRSGTTRGRVPWSAAREGRPDRRPGLR